MKARGIKAYSGDEEIAFSKQIIRGFSGEVTVVRNFEPDVTEQIPSQQGAKPILPRLVRAERGFCAFRRWCWPAGTLRILRDIPIAFRRWRQPLYQFDRAAIRPS